MLTSGALPDSRARPVFGSLIRGKSLCYLVNVKNITVSVEDDVYRRARIKAAEQDTSVSALVRKFLLELAGSESDMERLKRQEREIRERVRSFRARDRLSRDDVHSR